VLALVNPGRAGFAAQLERADMQQRLRVAATMLYNDLLMAGAGPDRGGHAGSLSYGLAPMLPYRLGTADDDPAGIFKPDAITLTNADYQPNTTAVVQLASIVYYLKIDVPTGTSQLMSRNGGTGTDAPVIDHLAALRFAYYGDPEPPMLSRALDDPVGPWTTYG